MSPATLTPHHVAAAFKLLRANGVKGGPDPADRDLSKLAMRTWLATLGDLTPDDLQAAVMGFLRDSAVCQWWPQPGILLAHVPRRAVSARVDDADDAWGETTRQVQQHASRIIYGGGPGAPPLPWEQGDDDRAEAIRRGLRAIGGPRTILNIGDRCLTTETEVTARHSFRNAYRAHLQGSAQREEQGKVLRLVRPSAVPEEEAPRGIAEQLAADDLRASLEGAFTASREQA